MKAHETFQNNSDPDVQRVIEQHLDSRLRIHFTYGDSLVITAFDPIDRTIYNESGGWTGTVVQPLCGRHPQFHKLFHAGSGIDFLEIDVVEIRDNDTDRLLFVRKQTSAEQGADDRMEQSLLHFVY